MWPDEPDGWSHLQAMAKRERDPQRLIDIIDRMNRLLDAYEGRAKRRDAAEASGKSPSKSLSP